MTDVEIGLAIQEAKESLKKLEQSKIKVIKELAEKLEKADMPLGIIAEEIIKALDGYVSKGYVRQCLDEKYKKFLKKVIAKPEDSFQYADNTAVEESPRIVIDTSGKPVAAAAPAEVEEVDDETDEQHDQRSEQSITDEVSKSMHTQEKPFINALPVEAVKEFNQVVKQQGEKIEELQQKLKAADERTKDAEYIKLEEKLTKLEEINARLLSENKQYSEAVVKHSFETATNVKIDPQQIRNYENMIKSLEDIIATKNFQINELTTKNESFAHIDTIGQPQPIELDVHKFVGIIFANRQNKVTLVHDNKTVLKIIEGGG